MARLNHAQAMIIETAGDFSYVHPIGRLYTVLFCAVTKCRTTIPAGEFEEVMRTEGF